MIDLRGPKWMCCTDPNGMLSALRARGSPRKFYLLGAAIYRDFWHCLGEGERRVVELAERHADGLASVDELLASAKGCCLWDREAAEQEMYLPDFISDASNGGEFVIAAEKAAKVGWAMHVYGCGPPLKDPVRASKAGHDQSVADLIRCVFGNPVQDVRVKREWQSPTVVAVARGVYDERAFDRLPILADAMEDAGCDSAHILDHCRGLGPHARGCWVIDLVLGKE